MKNIKFRAWDDELKVMHYGIGVTSLSVLIFEDVGNKMKVPQIIAEIGIERDEIYVMQYTGLHDKNGKEIYEGDIISWKHGRSEVKWVERKSSETYGHGDYGVSSTVGFVFDGYYGQPEESEVIGNIYENPELLK
jgi:uncharacterized phage protein (TIGR01671 family)